MVTRLKSVSVIFLFLLALAQAHADVTLLLEEPYSYDGAFAGTGHAAVYLSRVCAESPLVLRRCAPGEFGAVISRYDGIAGRDWIAIPLIPYLYAVDNPENVPLSADAKLVDFLRNRYRIAHLESVAPDGPDGEPPTGRWVELVGASYLRAIYGFHIDTTEEQDDALIRKYNSEPNRMQFNIITHNCADFARELVNSDYPKMLHRSLIGDLGVTTPKHDAQLFVRFGEHHPDLHLTTFVIPQVPGNIRRSGPVRGVVESVVRAKKYMVPLLVFHPLITGALVLAAANDARFNPAHNAMVFDPSGELDPPLEAAQRRAYEARLDSLKRPLAEGNPWYGTKWQQLQADSVPRVDSSGDPLLQVKLGDDTVELGLSRNNILNTSAPPELAEWILIQRLREELKKGGSPKVSEQDAENDWALLQQTMQIQHNKPEPIDSRLTAMQSAAP
ncbi:MAG: hypothetical protein WB711_15040 [Terriglobales bacterium]